MLKTELMILTKYLETLTLQLITAGLAIMINIWQQETQKGEFSFTQLTVSPLHAVRDTTIQPWRPAYRARRCPSAWTATHPLTASRASRTTSCKEASAKTAL